LLHLEKIEVLMAKQPPGRFLYRLFSRLGLGKILVLLLVMMIAGTVGSVGFLSFRYGQEGVNDLATQLQDSLQDRIKHDVEPHNKRASNF
jgi:hypothetical protein